MTDTHRVEGIELVELENLGEANSTPSPYTMLWWLKKILEALGGGGVAQDYRSTGLVDINTATYTDIVVVPLALGETFSLGECLVSLVGACAEVVIEYNNGSALEVIRTYVLNVQSPTHTEVFKNDVALSYVGAGSEVKVKAKSLYQDQEGKVFAALNGYK